MRSPSTSICPSPPRLLDSKHIATEWDRERTSFFLVQGEVAPLRKKTTPIEQFHSLAQRPGNNIIRCEQQGKPHQAEAFREKPSSKLTVIRNGCGKGETQEMVESLALGSPRSLHSGSRGLVAESIPTSRVIAGSKTTCAILEKMGIVVHTLTLDSHFRAAGVRNCSEKSY